MATEALHKISCKAARNVLRLRRFWFSGTKALSSEKCGLEPSAQRSSFETSVGFLAGDSARLVARFFPRVICSGVLCTGCF